MIDETTKLAPEIPEGSQSTDEVMLDETTKNKPNIDEQTDDKPTELTIESYEGVKFADGVEFDENFFSKTKEMFKENGITPKTAQKLIDFNSQLQQKMQQEAFEKEKQALEVQSQKWKEEALSDPEYGGSHYDANQSFIAKGRDKFATKEFVQTLNEKGLTNHPEVLRMFYRLGKSVSEDNDITSNGTVSTKERSMAENFYK
jgi:hypothetical protein